MEIGDVEVRKNPFIFIIFSAFLLGNVGIEGNIERGYVSVREGRVWKDNFMRMHIIYNERRLDNIVKMKSGWGEEIL